MGGCYGINMNVKDPNNDQVDDFDTDYTEVTIINQFVVEPDVPQLEEVVFGADGLSLNFYFDSPTNTPIFDNSTIFACQKMLSFDGADSAGANCRWVTSRHLRATLSYIGTVKPGLGSTSMVQGNIITAECTVNDCSSYAYMAAAMMQISSPPDATVPYVSLSSSRLIGNCDDMILDPTGSTGHGGRPWTAVTWDVTEFNADVSNITLT